MTSFRFGEVKHRFQAQCKCNCTSQTWQQHHTLNKPLAYLPLTNDLVGSCFVDAARHQPQITNSADLGAECDCDEEAKDKPAGELWKREEIRWLTQSEFWRRKCPFLGKWRLKSRWHKLPFQKHVWALCERSSTHYLSHNEPGRYHSPGYSQFQRAWIACKD